MTGKLEYLRKMKKNEQPATISLVQTEPEQGYSDILDVIKETIKVHDLPENHYQLSMNQVLANYGNHPELGQFIVKEQVLCGQVFNFFGAEGREEAIEVLQLMKSEMEAYAVTNRNRKSNPIVMGIIKRLLEEDIPEPDKPAGIMGKFKKLLGLEHKEETEAKKAKV